MQIALWIDTPALGDTIAAIPTLRKLSQAYNDQKITVFTSKPFLFEGHPLVEKALKSDADKSGYKVYKTFQHLVGKNYNQHGESVEFRYSNMDLRQFHAVSLGFTLTEEEMDMDLYIESERELPVKDYVIIHPTHTWPTRTWDQEKWQELIDRLNDAGIPVVAVGRDAREVGFFNTDKPVMPINIKYGVNLLNDDANDPAQLRWMMNNRAKAVVTMDSGILHVAGTTDVNIIQLGSSIDNKLRAPYRHGSQDYKYQFVRGGCGEFCSSNMKYNVKVHGSIQGIPPQVRCLADKPTFECHPTVDQVLTAVTSLYEPIQKDPAEIKKAYITFAKGDTYFQLADYLKQSVEMHSDHDFVIYTENDLDKLVDMTDKPGQYVFLYKILTIQKALQEYDEVVWLDNDIVVNQNIDKIWNKGKLTNYPLVSDWRFAGFDHTPHESVDFNDPSVAIKAKQYIGLTDDAPRFEYVQACAIRANQACLPIFNEIEDLFELANTNPEVFADFTSGDETMLNLILRREKATETLGTVFMCSHFWHSWHISRQIQYYATGGDYNDVWIGQTPYTVLPKHEADDILFYHGTKHIEKVEDILQNLRMVKNLKDNGRAIITHTTQNYEDIIVNLAKSIKKYSKYPLIVYTIDYDATTSLNGLAICKRINLNLPTASESDFQEKDGNMYVNRATYRTYAALSAKVEAMIQATEDGVQEWLYLDGDCVANHNVDDLFDYTDQIEDYPLATTGPHEYVMMVKNGQLVGNPFIDDKANGRDNTKCLEWPLMDMFGLQPDQRSSYRTTNILLANQNCLGFLKEWRDTKNALPKMVDLNKYLPFHEETLYNVMVWKRNDKSLPMVYINVSSADVVRDFFTTDQEAGLKTEFYRLPEEKAQIKVFHGEKRSEEIEKIFQIVDENTKIKLLYLAPHLSTGGMPEFLLGRLKALQGDPRLDIHVVEYTCYAETYTVQRDQIKAMLGPNFHTIGHLGALSQSDREEVLKATIVDISPDIIHIEESPEAFDPFNKMSAETQSWLYQPSQSWKIVETCHNIWFDPREMKRVSPDAYLFVSPHHALETFSEEPSEKFEAFYPIIPQTKSESLRRKSLEILGLEDLSDAKHIVNIGLWTPGKNQVEAVEWATRLQALYPDSYQFHFVGNQASNFEHYWGPVMQNLPPNVHIHGERSDVETFYQLADAVVFNSTWECNPLALRQALGWPIPVMARNLPQYHSMYTDCLTEIQGDTTDPLRLIEVLNTKPTRNQNAHAMAKFKQEHLDAYLSTLKGPVKRTAHAREEYTITWQNGPKVTSKTGRDLKVEFWADGEMTYAHTLQGEGHWCKPAQNWFRDWTVMVDGHSHKLELKDKAVVVQFDSGSLGDTLSWVEPVREFRFKHGLKKVYLATHKNWLFDQDWYRTQGIEFVAPGTWPEDAVAVWNIGVYMEDPPGTAWFPNKNKRDWRKIYLGDIASDHLGIGRVERAPRLAYTGKHQQDRPYICIATASTAQAKYWNNPTGWQDLVNHYNAKGYDVYHISKEATDLKGIKKGPEDLAEVYKLLQGAETFFGISSGLSWFAWATDCPVVLISGFTPEECEFQNKKTLRIINKSVCNGCWAWDHFNRGDWNWCPKHKGTENHFECTKSITTDSVIQQVEQWQKQLQEA